MSRRCRRMGRRLGGCAHARRQSQEAEKRECDDRRALDEPPFPKFILKPRIQGLFHTSKNQQDVVQEGTCRATPRGSWIKAGVLQRLCTSVDDPVKQSFTVLLATRMPPSIRAASYSTMESVPETSASLYFLMKWFCFARALFMQVTACSELGDSGRTSMEWPNRKQCHQDRS